jgi:glycerol-3-phosphate acyltransferase PlsX
MNGGSGESSGATVALDGFGAERGFDVLAKGARMAAADGIRLRVFGPPERLGLERDQGIEVIACDQWISNDEDAVPAVRTRPEASVVRAARDVAAGNAQAMASAGSTGATMAAATFELRRLRGVQRPALAVQLPVPGGPVLFLDVGANVEVRAQHLVQFAYLGAAFSESVAAAHRILGQADGIDFAGNVEGDALPAGAADVVVTDGFTGNVALKLMEGTAKVVTAAIRDAARSNPLAGAGGLLMRPALGGLRRELHPDTTGGAILLGLRHVAVVGHGGSGAEGIANAVRLAARCVSVDAVERTAALLRSSGATRRDLAEDSDAADPVQA